MKFSQRNTLITIGTLGAAAVIMGAFGAHVLEEKLIANQYLETYHTAVRYHFYHVLALLGLTLLPSHVNKWKLISAIAFTAGIVLFSGSLYVLTLTGSSRLGIITPFGGLAFIVGWLSLIPMAFRIKSHS